MVPWKADDEERPLPSWRWLPSMRAVPKSLTWATQLLSNRMIEGFKSHWTMRKANGYITTINTYSFVILYSTLFYFFTVRCIWWPLAFSFFLWYAHPPSVCAWKFKKWLFIHMPEEPQRNDSSTSRVGAMDLASQTPIRAIPCKTIDVISESWFLVLTINEVS